MEVGEIVSPGQPIYKIGTSGFDGSQVVRIGLADKDVIKIKLSDTASVAFDAVPNELIKGIVTEIAGSANATTGLYNVELTLEGFLEDLKNGFIGKVELYPGTDSKNIKSQLMHWLKAMEQLGKFLYRRMALPLSKRRWRFHILERIIWWWIQKTFP